MEIVAAIVGFFILCVMVGVFLAFLAFPFVAFWILLTGGRKKQRRY